MKRKLCSTEMDFYLEKLFWPTIFCEENVYTIKPVVYSQGLWFDRTSCEAFINHVHLSGYVSCDDLEMYKKVAFIIAEMWRTKLKVQFPEEHFAVYLIVPEGKWSEKSNVTLRFCLIRDNEPPFTPDKADDKTLWIWET